MMDTPSQKITYNATVVAPSQFVVRMSANTTSTEMYNETHTISTFDAAIKIPSYLIAIVVGDLVESDLDERVSIISEPTYIDSAVEEFSELPEILDIAEAYLTPYAWGRYSIVIMPPSFPWGVRMGMTCVLDCLHK
jgi:aminopeptidase N